MNGGLMEMSRQYKHGTILLCELVLKARADGWTQEFIANRLEPSVGGLVDDLAQEAVVKLVISELMQRIPVKA